MLIQRRPHLGWFINLLGILLLCFLLINSILGSIYVNQLKSQMNEIISNYFIAQKEVLLANSSLLEMKFEVNRYIYEMQNIKNEGDFNELRNRSLQEFKKYSINFVGHLHEAIKQDLNHYMKASLDNLLLYITKYSLTVQESIYSQKNFDKSSINLIIEKLIELQSGSNKIKHDLEILSRIIEQKVVSLKYIDNFIIQYFPDLFFILFFVSLIIGGGFMYVSRREVKRSIIENARQVLYESQEYQKDCIETLEICKELTESGLKQINDVYHSIKNDLKSKEIKEVMEKFLSYTNKVVLAFETRKNLHAKEFNDIQNSLAEMKKEQDKTI